MNETDMKEILSINELNLYLVLFKPFKRPDPIRCEAVFPGKSMMPKFFLCYCLLLILLCKALPEQPKPIPLLAEKTIAEIIVKLKCYSKK